jgi:hypothetical protein
MRRTVRFACALALLAPAAARGQTEEAGFRPLVVGDDPGQFTLVEIGPQALAVRDGEVRVSGKPDGYFATKKAFRNYVLRFEWMYERPEGLTSDAAFQGNSGLLLHIKDHKVWPESIEVQLMNADAGNTFAIPPARFRGAKDAASQKRAIKPVGAWNAQEVTCRDGTVVVTINGVEVARGRGAEPDRGPIGWQSEGAPIRFRGIRIKELE